ncbi:MAG: diacylglycerol kinase [Deltaproteobacteria bacterium]|nr:diacylglycerol kinase [Deltaproteobacteria bacterium]
MTKKKPTGIVRIIKAAGYSMAGMKAAWKHEAAFRQEVFALAVLLPLGFFLGRNGIERAMLISSVMIVLVTELLNSALEALVDRTGLEYHPLAKQTKDMGSAAVFVSIAIVVIVWILILSGRY